MTEYRDFQRGDVTLSLAEGSGHGPRFLFQHGLCGDAVQTMEAAPSMLNTKTLECRGHGRSDAGDPRDYSIGSFANDVAAVAESYDSPCILGGISMGAAISLRLAVLRPELMRALILVRPAWAVEAAPENMRPMLEVGRVLSQRAASGEADTFRNSGTGQQLAEIAPDNLNSLIGFFTRETREVTAGLLTAISLDGPGVTEAQVKALNIPTLIVGTDKDYVHPLAHATRLHDLIPGAELVEITPKSRDLAAHMQELRAAIQNFTESLPNA